MNNRTTILDEWMQPNPSPRTLFASFLNDDFTPRALADPLAQTRTENEMDMNTGEEAASSEEEAQSKEVNFPQEFSLQPHLHAAGPRQLSSNGGLAERMAARAGFNVPKLNTSRVNQVANVVGSSTDVRSPYLTIPPGLSPTTLLESPVFLSNLVRITFLTWCIWYNQYLIRVLFYVCLYWDLFAGNLSLGYRILNWQKWLNLYIFK